MRKPARSTSPEMSLVTWQPPATRFQAGSTRNCQRVRTSTVLDEMERATRLQYSTDLGQRCVDVRDRAQRPGGECGVELSRRKVQFFAGEACELNLDRGRSDPRLGNSQTQSGWFDSGDSLNAVGVVRSVQPSPKADLDDVARESRTHTTSNLAQVLAVHDLVLHPWEKEISIYAHNRSSSSSQLSEANHMALWCPKQLDVYFLIFDLT